jgi:hypothetical protein
MLERTQKILEKVDRLLDEGDTESAGKLLLPLDRVSLRALLINATRETGAPIADAIAESYLHAVVDTTEQPKTA